MKMANSICGTKTKRSQMNKANVYQEPGLVFGLEQRLSHPRDGVTLFGPFDSKGIEKPRQITYALFGTPDGIQSFRAFSAALNRPILTEERYDEVLWSHFPGFEEAFHAVWSAEPAWQDEIKADKLSEANEYFGTAPARLLSRQPLPRRNADCQTTRRNISCFCLHCSRLRVRLLPCVGDRPEEAPARRGLREAMGDFFESFDPRQYGFSLDFRRQIKARVMELEVPIQIVRESTLRLHARESMAERELTPLSDRAWNLATALYYKSGGKPWKLGTARDGVCYVGVAFKDTEDRDNNACSAAQMFLDDGDGVVFLGDYGRWYSERKGEYHLSRPAAKNLLAGVLKTYHDQHGKPLNEVFLHCRSSINDEEFAGYKEACPEGVKLVGIRVAPERLGLRLYRNGTRPVFRGTFWPVSTRRGFLWASGFKPRLRTYDGSEVPQPLCIDIQHGEADLELVAKDILELTKLNYNCCKLGEHQPVTIHFSDAVGEILVANRGAKKVLPNFKYYI